MTNKYKPADRVRVQGSKYAGQNGTVVELVRDYPLIKSTFYRVRHDNDGSISAYIPADLEPLTELGQKGGVR